MCCLPPASLHALINLLATLTTAQPYLLGDSRVTREGMGSSQQFLTSGRCFLESTYLWGPQISKPFFGATSGLDLLNMVTFILCGGTANCLHGGIPEGCRVSSLLRSHNREESKLEHRII